MTLEVQGGLCVATNCCYKEFKFKAYFFMSVQGKHVYRRIETNSISLEVPLREINKVLCLSVLFCHVHQALELLLVSPKSADLGRKLQLATLLCTCCQ